MMCVIYLRSISLKSNNDLSYPFNVANSLVKDTMDFPTPVTFFVGENGSGKSTLLEAIAAGINLPAIGGEAIAYDETLGDIRKLGQHLKLVWNRRTTRGFFMRSEDFFNFTRRIKKLTKELAEEAKAFEEYLTGYGLQLARGSVLGQRQALIEKYGEDLQAYSHGEGILNVLNQRIVPGGIYLLDEPETPFSPQRQLALISIIKQMAEADCQFIIATHSPMLLAFPNATIYSFDESPVRTCQYTELEHVNLTKDFLNAPEAFLRHL